MMNNNTADLSLEQLKEIFVNNHLEFDDTINAELQEIGIDIKNLKLNGFDDDSMIDRDIAKLLSNDTSAVSYSLKIQIELYIRSYL